MATLESARMPSLRDKQLAEEKADAESAALQAAEKVKVEKKIKKKK